MFAFSSALNSLSDYVRDIDAIVLLDSGPTRSGSRFLHRRHLFGLRVERVVTITEWNPPHRFVASFEAAGTIIDSVHIIEPRPSGCTFTLALSAHPRGLLRLPKLLLWQLLLPAIARGVRREVHDVRARVENTGRTADVRAWEDGQAVVDSVQ